MLYSNNFPLLLSYSGTRPLASSLHNSHFIKEDLLIFQDTAQCIILYHAEDVQVTFLFSHNQRTCFRGCYVV